MKEILSRVDHTLLGVTATAPDYLKLCDEGLQYQVASVCVPPSRVALCANHTAGKLAICTVVGFPNGYADTEAKAHEAAAAIRAGATEIDMVIDIGMAKEHNYAAILADIKKVRAACGTHILKVIIETALLTEEEKIALCGTVGESGADYIKTSTGFALTGATFEDVALLRKHSPAHVKVKAAGGIATLEDAKKFIELGADRLGTSRVVKLVQGMEGTGY
ncbi:MAG: deoxyribose-phosphate aldolase [Defluviitaleaceae bacterium]|nr:deoxyribose-phosphate aldolase [Defluviitaleaceae bacterium]MCL2275825.1 deoxyribose-phosphate aldolase [Defluviitaleaceae bacterium]